MLNQITILFIGTCLSSITLAQTIDSIAYSPQNPTWEDTITVYCYVKYPQSGCELVNQDVNSVGYNFVARAFHCGGWLTMLCPTIDSFKVKGFDGFPGTYTFYYMPGFIMDSSQCTFPIFGNGDTIPYPYAVENIEIPIISPVNSVKNELDNYVNFEVYPNPTIGQINVTGLTQETTRVVVYNVLGELVYDDRLIDNQLDLSSLSSGAYILHVTQRKTTFRKKVIKL